MPREKRTLIPTFDPTDLAREIEQEAQRGGTAAPPFDRSAYARIVEERVEPARGIGVTRSSMLPAARPIDLRSIDPGFDASDVTAVTEVAPAAPSNTDLTVELDSVDTLGREMYGCYLASDFPEALVLAERVLSRQPAHALAQLVVEQCHARLQPSRRALNPASVLRLKQAEVERQASHLDPTSSLVLGHVDGVSDAATVAELSGLPDTEALDRLHALLDLGLLEVVNG